MLLSITTKALDNSIVNAYFTLFLILSANFSALNPLMHKFCKGIYHSHFFLTLLLFSKAYLLL